MAKSSSTIQMYQKVQISPTNGESKRNSKNSSTTPTPTNPDIVRIYVPPADDMLPDIRKYEQRDRGDDEISQCSNRSSIIHVEYEMLPFERPQPSSPPSKTDQTSNNGAKAQQQQQPQPQQYYYYPNPNQSTPQQQQQSSSSRRGSMNRKTPSPLLSDLIVECDHIKSRRSQDNIYDENNKLNNNNNNVLSGSLKRLTSFEELAKKSDSNSLLFIHESIDNNFRYNSNNSYGSSKPRSDYGICYSYKNLDSELDQNSKNNQMMKKSTSHSYNIRRSSERKHSSSDNSPFDYDLLKEKRKDHHRHHYDNSEGRHMETNDNSIKSYDRFFNSDDECDDDDVRSRTTSKRTTQKYRSHISGTEADDDEEDNSSNSPTNKSIPCTPLNDTLPLLSSDVEPTLSGYQIPPPVLPSPSSTNSLRSKSRIPRPNRNKSSSVLTKNSSVSSPDGSDRSEGFRLNQPVSYQSPNRSVGGNSVDTPSQKSDNKIRIKINQKN